MSGSNISIDGKRLLADLYRLREFGAYKTGVHRPTFSPVDMDSRRWLAERMREAGLEPEIDGIGNVIGRGIGEGPRLLLGSHTETQNQAGWLDGALGVMYGLEIARTLGRGIDVVSWADEEGHFGSFLGSRSYLGLLSEAEMDAARNRYDDTTLREALRVAGLEGKPRIRHQPGRYRGYLEAHIEQGDELDSSGGKIGVVTSIVGIWQYRITFEGVQNHAGTTRMAIRKDAGVALVKLASAVEAKFPTVCGPRSVWTVGRITLSPGAASIVPGGAEMLLQFRDADPDTLKRLEETLEAIVAEANASGPCNVMLHNLSRSTPSLMDEGFQAALDRAAERFASGRHRRMPSGAGHDAQWLARVMPAAMLFVPSIGGISHHWSENTADDDIVLGCQVLGAAAAEILSS
ncbi:MAG TPA: Zn-dependent hydrolase [Acetobacteraceae bacterium]